MQLRKTCLYKYVYIQGSLARRKLGYRVHANVCADHFDIFFNFSAPLVKDASSETR